MAETWTTIPFDDISTGETVTAAQLNALGNNHRFQAEVGYQEKTTDVSVTATTVGTANEIVTLGAITYDAVPHLIEFWGPRADQAASVCNVILRDGTTVLGTLTRLVASQNQPVLYLARRLTPTAASHTYNVAAWVGSGTWTFQAGTGGTAGDSTTDLPIWIRATRIPT